MTIHTRQSLKYSILPGKISTLFDEVLSHSMVMKIDPGRIDFAKEKYGGPFTTEQVEDVKTFFRVLAILVVVGPAFFLDVPGTALLYQYANHTANSHDACTWP